MITLRQATMCALLAIACVAPARADELADAKALRRSGQILTGIGGGLQLVGAGLFVGAVSLPPNCAFVLGAPEEGPCAYGGGTKYDDAARGLFLGGIVVSVIGDVVAIVGGVQWGVGARRARRLRASH